MTLAELRDLADRMIAADPTTAHAHVLTVRVGYDTYRALTGETEPASWREELDLDLDGPVVVLETH